MFIFYEFRPFLYRYRALSIEKYGKQFYVCALLGVLIKRLYEMHGAPIKTDGVCSALWSLTLT